MSITVTLTVPEPGDAEFSAKMRTLFLALNTWAVEANVMAGEMEQVEKWVSGTTYTEGQVVWSPITYKKYRRKNNGGGTTDPSSDTTNWEIQTIALPSQAGNALKVLKTDGAFLYWGFGGLIESIAVIADVKSSGSDGGSFSAGARRIRELNTEIADPNGIVSINGNEFTLQTGKYFTEWMTPAYRVGKHQSFLYNVDDATDEQDGSPGFSSDTTFNALSYSVGTHLLTVSDGPKEYRIEHDGEISRSNDGFGIGSDRGGDEIFTTVKIFKLAG